MKAPKRHEAEAKALLYKLYKVLLYKNYEKGCKKASPKARLNACWSARDKELFLGYRDGLIERGYTVDDLKDDKGVALERWMNWGFKEGHLGRLRSEARVYKSYWRIGA